MIEVDQYKRLTKVVLSIYTQAYICGQILDADNDVINC